MKRFEIYLNTLIYLTNYARLRNYIWWLTTIQLGWHATAFPHIKSRRMSFFVICPCHEPAMVGPQGTLGLVTTPWTRQGTDVFLGSVIRTRGRKEKSTVANRIIFFLSLALILMGAWGAW